MKKAAFLIAFSLTSLVSIAQDITGQWNGMLKVPGAQLRLVLNITKTDTGYSATMDSPDQGAAGIPVTTTTFENGKLSFSIPAGHIEYTGELKDKAVVGTFKQNGMEFPMNLSREAIEKKEPKRPQEPKEPFAYYSEDVTFTNAKDNITLAGTLTLPKKEGVYPVVILVSGSGPQNRNEELLGHKPFLVLADYLTKQGIGVLRYDDRGVGESKGDFKTATTADFATDAASAVAYLKTCKECNAKKIGIMGHSEGGVIAPMVAAQSKDVSFIVLLAGTGIPGDELLLLQQEAIARVEGATDAEIASSKATNRKVFDMIKSAKDASILNADLTKYLTNLQKNPPKGEKAPAKPQGLSDEGFVALQVSQIANPWMTYFIKYNPATALEKVKCAVLAVNGEKDLQVPPKENLSAINKALLKAGNKNVTLHEFPGLNHLFQECKTGSPNEYADIEQTFSPDALAYVAQWINNQTK
ncbi:alpha/beta hydrolase family protein [Flavobacterium phycosphaerae]|uniref:alpha/beta hydrolase family protein n=1 Tax=Flavobacterium phycosphaerae TaxID=2697515 RepID=UPI00138ACE49|nr:alpha/beta hydrolase [Flavobacterium phycosphaerae]